MMNPADIAVEMAQRGIRYIEDALQAKHWKRDHEQAMKVLELERLFEFIRDAVEAMFRADNQMHLRSAESGEPRVVDEWNKAFRQCPNARLRAGLRTTFP